MKIIFFLSILLSSTLSLTQGNDIILKSFVKKDHIQLRWASTNPDLFIQGLNNGYQITRIENKTGTKKIIDIPPFQNRKHLYASSKDSSILLMLDFLTEYSKNSFENNLQKSLPFFGLVLAAGSNKELADLCGLYADDSTKIKTELTYELRINGINKVQDQIVVNPKKKDSNPPCSNLTGISRIDLKEAYLSWEAISQINDYSAYWILKSTDKINFSRLNRTPVYYLTSEYEPNKRIVDYVDTAVVEGGTYYYQIQPINHFGELGSVSNIAEVYIQKRLSGICKIDTIYRAEYKRIIQGEYISLNNDEIKSFLLFRSSDVDKGFELIDEFKTTNWNYQFEYTSDVKTGDRQYFKVGALSVDEDTVFSFAAYHFSYDQEPPGVPTELNGFITDSGFVKLNWNPPSDDDIKGYRLYRQNSLEEEYKEVTTRLAENPFYIDTLRLDNLSSNIYYSIRSVDQNHNNSPISEPVLLLKPDTIPPVPPVFKSYKIQTNGILLKWSNSLSSDINEQGLLRSNKNRIDTLLMVQNQDSTFIDTTAINGKTYTYMLYASDKSKNTSTSNTLKLTFENGVRKSVKGLSGIANRVDKTIELSWKLDERESIYSINIYRAKNESELKLHTTIFNPTVKYIDNELSPNNTYTYKIQIKYQSGHSSVLSEGVVVQY